MIVEGGAGEQGGRGGSGEKVRKSARGREEGWEGAGGRNGWRKRGVGFPDIDGLSFLPWEQMEKEEQHVSLSGPTVSRTEPEAHSQTEGPYTSA